jgi:hypothetical protein
VPQLPEDALPAAVLTVFIHVGPAAAWLDRKKAPVIHVALADSLTLTPPELRVGPYTGPRMLATAPVAAILPPASLLAIVRSPTMDVQAADRHIPMAPATRATLLATYRLALCGYGSHQ